MKADLHWRLEPQQGPLGDLQRGFAAELGDPLWLLGRQWHMGEHQGENASTPLVVELSVSETPIGAPADRASQDPLVVPAEAIIEGTADDTWTLGKRIAIGLRALSEGRVRTDRRRDRSRARAERPAGTVRRAFGTGLRRPCARARSRRESRRHPSAPHLRSAITGKATSSRTARAFRAATRCCASIVTTAATSTGGRSMPRGRSPSRRRARGIVRCRDASAIPARRCRASGRSRTATSTSAASRRIARISRRCC